MIEWFVFMYLHLYDIVHMWSQRKTNRNWLCPLYSGPQAYEQVALPYESFQWPVSKYYFIIVNAVIDGTVFIPLSY